MAKSGVTMTKNTVARIDAATALLAKTQVMVGIPSEKAGRKEGPITNAALGYIHENGAPEVNIPARPFLVPGIKEAQNKIEGYLKQAGGYALDGKPDSAQKALNAAGLAGQNSVKAKIGSNIAPPLAPATIAARKRRGVTRENTLIDTGQLQGAIIYVIREK